MTGSISFISFILLYIVYICYIIKLNINKLYFNILILNTLINFKNFFFIFNIIIKYKKALFFIIIKIAIFIIIYYLLFIIYYLLFNYLLFIIYYLLFIIYYLLFIIPLFHYSIIQFKVGLTNHLNILTLNKTIYYNIF